MLWEKFLFHSKSSLLFESGSCSSMAMVIAFFAASRFFEIVYGTLCQFHDRGIPLSIDILCISNYSHALW